MAELGDDCARQADPESNPKESPPPILVIGFEEPRFVECGAEKDHCGDVPAITESREDQCQYPSCHAEQEQLTVRAFPIGLSFGLNPKRRQRAVLEFVVFECIGKRSVWIIKMRSVRREGGWRRSCAARMHHKNDKERRREQANHQERQSENRKRSRLCPSHKEKENTDRSVHEQNIAVPEQ